MQVATTQITDTQLHGIMDFPGEEFFAFAKEHGLDSKLFCIFAGCEGIYEPQKALEAFDSYNAGAGKDLTSWAKKFAEASGLLHKLPETVRPYFDYAAWARDAVQNGDIWVIELYDDEIAVFASRPTSWNFGKA